MITDDLPNLLGKNILLVEDDLLVKEATTIVLRGYGLQVEAVSSLEEALLKIKENKNIDLVILDMNLPGSNGISSYQTIRSEVAVMPLLICSGESVSDLDFEWRKDHNLKFLQKPYEPEQLILLISLMLP